MYDFIPLHEELAGVTVVGRDRTEVLTDIAGIARRAMPGSQGASITLISGQRAYTAAYDGSLALNGDDIQHQYDDGPCLDAALAGVSLLVDDISTELRWPEFAAHAAGVGARSSLSLPLPFQGTVIGALNNYSSAPAAFTEADAALGAVIAGWVALAVGNADYATRTAEEVGHLHAAMVSRAAIEQAKGIVMERRKVTADEAFTILARASQNANLKLRHVAEQLVRTGVLAGTDA
jgi:GAF domain-containing protein